jgi:hypothetical protein
MSKCSECSFYISENECKLPISHKKDKDVKTAEEHYESYFGWKCKREFNKEKEKK